MTGAAIRAMSEQLIELGHRRFAIVTIRTTTRVRTSTQDKLADYRDSSRRVMSERLAGIAEGLHGAAASAPVLERPMNLTSEGAAAVEQILRDRPDITAIVCLTDVLALGVLLALDRRGVAVPGEILLARAAAPGQPMTRRIMPTDVVPRRTTGPASQRPR